MKYNVNLKRDEKEIVLFSEAHDFRCGIAWAVFWKVRRLCNIISVHFQGAFLPTVSIATVRKAIK